MVDDTPGADPGPGDAQSEAGDRFPDIAPEGPPDLQSTDWSGGPIPSAAAPESSGGPPPDGEPSPTPTPEAPAASDVPPLVAPPADPGAEPPPPVAWTPVAPAAPLVWGAAAAPPAGSPAASPAPELDGPPAAGPPSAGAGAPPPVGWVVAAAPVTPEIAPGLQFASTWRRFGAWIIDSILMVLLAWLVAIPLVLILSSYPGLLSVGGAVAIVAVTFGYFALGWRSRAHGTPAMRLFKLQIGNAFDGRPLTMDQAFRRWVAMGYPLYLVSLLPLARGLVGLGIWVLAIALLLSTASSQTKQGLHDRLANSAIVQPIGLGNGAIVGCVIVLLILPLLAIVGIVALLFLGGQVSQILSTVGSPAP